MTIAKQQQAIIRELRADLAKAQATIGTYTEYSEQYSTALLRAKTELTAVKADLVWYKIWTYVQLCIIAYIAYPKAVSIVLQLFN